MNSIHSHDLDLSAAPRGSSYYLRRRQEGVCLRCPAPSHGKVHCPACAAKMRDARLVSDRRRAGIPVDAPLRCGPRAGQYPTGGAMSRRSGLRAIPVAVQPKRKAAAAEDIAAKVQHLMSTADLAPKEIAASIGRSCSHVRRVLWQLGYRAVLITEAEKYLLHARRRPASAEAAA